MKRCPQCNRVETDESLKFCRVDGTTLINDLASISGEAGTAQIGSAALSSEIETSVLPHRTDAEINRHTVPTPVLPATATPSTTHELTKPNRRGVVIGLIALVILGFVIGGYFYFSRKTTSANQSIAVLPFENRSGNPDTDYLSDGLAESLIFRLSQLPGLKVSPTTSVMRYKGNTDLAKVAKDLGVDAIMTGHVLQRGDNLNITVELVDVRNNKSLWGERYERKMSDLLATQREIAATIADKLQLKLAGNDAKGITRKYTDSNEAYQLWLKGRYSFGKRTKEGHLQAIGYFRQAIKLDPKFALAYARLAETYGSMSSYPYLSPKEAFPEAKTAARQALEIDPTLAEAHTFLAYSLVIYDWNWAEGERSFKRAIELDPNNSAAHFRYGQIYLAPMGRLDEGIAEIKRGLELDPLDINMAGMLAWAYLASGQNDTALEQAKKTYDLEPTHPIGRWTLSEAYIAKEMYREAVLLDEQWLRNDPTNQLALREAGIAYAKVGRRDKAEEMISKFREVAKTEYVPACRIASIYAALGDKDKAFVELNKAFDARDWELFRLNLDPYWKPLRDDLRFKEMLKRVDLP